MKTVRIPLKRDVVTTETVRAGSIAARFYKALAELIDAERQIDGLLTALYGSYSDFEIGPDGIDIYDAVDSAAAASALFRAGFRSVRAHDHDKTKFAKCSCSIRKDILA